MGMASATGKLYINEWQALKAGVRVRSLQRNHWLTTIVCIKYLINENLKEIYVKVIHWKKTGWFYSKNYPCKAVLLAVIKITGIRVAHPALKDVYLRLQKDTVKDCEKNLFYCLCMKLSEETKQQCWVLGLVSIFQQMTFTLWFPL